MTRIHAMGSGCSIMGSTWRKVGSNIQKERHVLNKTLGLRYPLAIYRNTGDEALKTQTRTAVDLLAKYHRGLHGSILADEYVTNLSPTRGSELCIAVEVMWSSAYIYQYLGDNDIADWTEQAAFNALPGAVAADWWSHQYVQLENQVGANRPS